MSKKHAEDTEKSSKQKRQKKDHNDPLGEGASCSYKGDDFISGISDFEIGDVSLRMKEVLDNCFKDKTEININRNIFEDIVSRTLESFINRQEHLNNVAEVKKLREKCNNLQTEQIKLNRLRYSLQRQVEDAKFIVKKLIDQRVAAHKGHKRKNYLPTKRTRRSVGIQVCTAGDMVIQQPRTYFARVRASSVINRNIRPQFDEPSSPIVPKYQLRSSLVNKPASLIKEEGSSVSPHIRVTRSNSQDKSLYNINVMSVSRKQIPRRSKSYNTDDEYLPYTARRTPRSASTGRISLPSDISNSSGRTASTGRSASTSRVASGGRVENTPGQTIPLVAAGKSKMSSIAKSKSMPTAVKSTTFPNPSIRHQTAVKSTTFPGPAVRHRTAVRRTTFPAPALRPQVAVKSTTFPGPASRHQMAVKSTTFPAPALRPQVAVKSTTFPGPASRHPTAVKSTAGRSIARRSSKSIDEIVSNMPSFEGKKPYNRGHIKESQLPFKVNSRTFQANRKTKVVTEIAEDSDDDCVEVIVKQDVIEIEDSDDEAVDNSTSVNKETVVTIKQEILDKEYEESSFSVLENQIKENEGIIKTDKELSSLSNDPLPTTSQGPLLRIRSPENINQHFLKTQQTVDPSPVPSTSRGTTFCHLPKYPAAPKYPPNVSKPPAPILQVSQKTNFGIRGIMLTWSFTCNQKPENIEEYQLYTHQEPDEQSRDNIWRKIGDIKALPLPMACFLSQFLTGKKYHFIIRAVDTQKRIGDFSIPAGIILNHVDDGSQLSSPNILQGGNI